MANNISPQAYVNPAARLGDNVTIYPFAYIEGDVQIGDGCVIYPYVSLMDGTRLGKNNNIHQGTVLAALPQDFDYCGEKTELVIGDNNTIRENVVINRATHSTGKTIIGNGNFIMEGVHISHDTVICDKCVIGYGTKIAGDCIIQNNAILSSNVVFRALLIRLPPDIFRPKPLPLLYTFIHDLKVRSDFNPYFAEIFLKEPLPLRYSVTAWSFNSSLYKLFLPVSTNALVPCDS